MLTKITNSLLILVILTSLFLTAKNYFALEEIQTINSESKNHIMSFLSKLLEKEATYANAYIARSGYLINKNSFLDIGKNFTNKLDIATYETYKILKPLDSIIKNDPLAQNWKTNKIEIQKIFATVSQFNKTIRQELNKYDLEDIFQKNKISFEEWRKVIYLSVNLKSILRGNIGLCQCIDPSYSFIGIPSKKAAFLGDTISIDWVNYYRGHVFINQTYKIKSNYDNFHILETSYDGCGFCDVQAESILLQEYQIPFSKIEKNKKWRSVFYFRNDKLEQDSVVLERELEF